MQKLPPSEPSARGVHSSLGVRGQEAAVMLERLEAHVMAWVWNQTGMLKVLPSPEAVRGLHRTLGLGGVGVAKQSSLEALQLTPLRNQTDLADGIARG